MFKSITYRLLIVTIGAGLLVTGCSQSTTPPSQDIAVEAQAVTEATATPVPTPTPAPTAQPTSTRLPTELLEEPVSPVSPVTPGTEVMPDTLPNNIPPGSETAVNAAIQDLSSKQGIPVDQISVVSVEPVDWNDSSLGCPQEGMMYAQVITPGYLIILQAQGQQYEYHTDQNKTVVLCQK